MFGVFDFGESYFAEGFLPETTPVGGGDGPDKIILGVEQSFTLTGFPSVGGGALS